MAYFKIGAVDFSTCVSKLHVARAANYNAQTNAAGNTVVDLINHKRTIEVGIIPLEGEAMQALLSAIEGFNVSVTFLNPSTGALEENVNCIIPESNVDYYTIQANKVMFTAFTLKFVEL